MPGILVVESGQGDPDPRHAPFLRPSEPSIVCGALPGAVSTSASNRTVRTRYSGRMSSRARFVVRRSSVLILCAAGAVAVGGSPPSRTQPETAAPVPAPTAPAVQAPIKFEIDNEFGPEGDWTEAYLNKAAAAMVRLMDNPEVTLPETIPVLLKKDPGIGA